MPVLVEPTQARASELLDLTLRHELASHDAARLDLALRLRLPIATRDAALREAALASGAGIFAVRPARGIQNPRFRS